MSIDHFFQAATEPAHPLLQDWSKRLPPVKTTGSALLDLYQPKGEFAPARPEMHVQFYDDNKETELDSVPWEDDLNAGLVRLGVRAKDHDTEGQRFALSLRAALRDVVREVGDGYFHAVLVDLIKQSNLTQHPEIAAIMKYAYANEPYREGPALLRYQTCHNFIVEGIRGRARELKDNLKYSQEEAKGILVAALAHYLDNQFSVTSRRELGLL